MAGNVWEWVNDYYQSDYYAILGGQCFQSHLDLQSGDYRVLRGGSWFKISISTPRSAYRVSDDPSVAVRAILAFVAPAHHKSKDE